MTFSCATLTEQRHRQRTCLFLSIALFISSFPFLSSFSPPLSCASNTFQLSRNNALTSNADGNQIKCNLAHLHSICTSSSLPLSFSVGLWNCQSMVNKADLIPAIASQTALSILGLTETWLHPEDSATPAALSNNFSFSHTPRQVRKRGGTGLLISNNWTYSTYTPLCNNYSLESHAITVTAPVKLHVVVIYCPPGQLGTFLEELDGLLSSFPKDGSPLMVFGDINVHLNKPYAANFHSLLASFDFKWLTTTSTHKSGSQLDLIYTRNCVADNILVKPLHTSDHYFIAFNLHLATSEPPTPLPFTFRRNFVPFHPHIFPL